MNQRKGDPIIIIGAGIAGLTAAQLLDEARLPVLVLDKGRGVGGRMATRRFGSGRFDHGAQYFTVRDARLQQRVTAWQNAGIVTTWAHSFGEQDRDSPALGHPRYRGSTGMTAVPKHMAQQLDVRLNTQVTALAQMDNQWIVHTRGGEQYRSRATLLTPPVPQSLAILQAGQVALPEEILRSLAQITYHPCLALLALFAGPSQIPAPGGLRLADGPVAWIADNHQKGISPDGYAITIHAAPDYSRQHWDSPADAVARELMAAVAEALPTQLIDWQLQRWRYSQPATTFAQDHLLIAGPPALVFAGDAFGGPRVEGAVLSGHSAAEALLETLN